MTGVTNMAILGSFILRRHLMWLMLNHMCAITTSRRFSYRMIITRWKGSFISVIFVSGRGSITVDSRTLEFKAGESFFVTAGKKNIIIHGESECIVTHV